MKILKYILWSPILTVLVMLIIGVFGLIWDYHFNPLLTKIWFSLVFISFFCLALLSTIEKAEKSINLK